MTDVHVPLSESGWDGWLCYRCQQDSERVKGVWLWDRINDRLARYCHSCAEYVEAHTEKFPQEVLW